MRNHKIHRFGSLLALFLLLSCLLTVSAFAGDYDRWGYETLIYQLDSELTPEQQETELVRLQMIYNVLKDALSTVEDGANVETVVFEKTVIDEAWMNADVDENGNSIRLYNVIRALVADYPEYYWFDGAYGVAEYENGDLYLPVTISLFYTHTGAAERALFEETANELLSCISEEESEYVKSRKIHDALAAHIVYDLDRQEEQTAFSGIADGRAVCAGYARAYQYLMNRAGIKAWTVEGGSLDPADNQPVPHAWNLVWLDGDCYYTDVTWDDQGESLYHAYFNNTFAEIRLDHDAYSYVVLPECEHGDDAKSVNYFVQEQKPGNGVIVIDDSTTAANFAEAVKKVDNTFVVDTWCMSEDFQNVTEWLNSGNGHSGSDILAALREAFSDDPLFQEHSEWAFSFAWIGNEVKVVIFVSPYDGLGKCEGYIDTVENRELHAYVSYLGIADMKKATFSAVMVAYYSEEHALQDVAFTTIKTDINGRAELTADCPDDFSYCRIFVVASAENPAPRCDLLQLAMPQ